MEPLRLMTIASAPVDTVTVSASSVAVTPGGMSRVGAAPPSDVTWYATEGESVAGREMPAHFSEPSGQVASGQAWLASRCPAESQTAKASVPATVPRANGMPQVVPPLSSEGAPPSIHLTVVFTVIVSNSAVNRCRARVCAARESGFLYRFNLAGLNTVPQDPSGIFCPRIAGWKGPNSR